MFLIDTNVISEINRPRPEQKVLNWIEENQAEFFLSVITIAEIQSGISQVEGRRKEFYQRELDQLRLTFHNVILPFDEMAAITWGHLDAELKRRGRPIPIRDSFLAATALQHGLTIATRNEKDFFATGVKIFNPWK